MGGGARTRSRGLWVLELRDSACGGCDCCPCGDVGEVGAVRSILMLCGACCAATICAGVVARPGTPEGTGEPRGATRQ